MTEVSCVAYHFTAAAAFMDLVIAFQCHGTEELLVPQQVFISGCMWCQTSAIDLSMEFFHFCFQCSTDEFYSECLWK